MKDIKGYEGLYAITEDGKVWSYSKKDWKAQSLNQSGYLVVDLWKNNTRKLFTVHRLVAEAYIPNSENYPVVNHKDKNKQNNRVQNLEWCTISYNNKHGSNKKVKCLETGVVYPSLTAAAQAINRGKSTLCSHLKGNTSHCAGYHWEYVQEGL